MIAIFNYHAVSDRDYEYAVSPETFEAQLRYLQSRFRILSLSELEQTLGGETKSDHDLVVITFDDAMADLYSNAFPILTKLQVPATIFVPTDFPGRTVTIASGEEFSYLSWEQMREMSAGGLISFQSHTHTHPILTEVANASEIERELDDSVSIIEKQLRQRVDHFAYPKGRANSRTREFAKARFRLACAGEGIINSLKRLDPWALPRIVVRRSWPLWKFKLLCRPSFWYLRAIKHKLF
jgi:peptidoglycan/xylan/chitin deacetylase (PgdA/CDA1 family)